MSLKNPRKTPFIWIVLAFLFVGANALPVISANPSKANEINPRLAKQIEGLKPEIKQKIMQRVQELEKDLKSDVRGIRQDSLEVRKKRGKIQIKIAELNTQIKNAPKHQKADLDAEKERLIEEFETAVSDDQSFRIEFNQLNVDYARLVKQIIEDVLKEEGIDPNEVMDL